MAIAEDHAEKKMEKKQKIDANIRNVAQEKREMAQ